MRNAVAELRQLEHDMRKEASHLRKMKKAASQKLLKTSVGKGLRTSTVKRKSDLGEKTFHEGLEDLRQFDQLAVALSIVAQYLIQT